MLLRKLLSFKNLTGKETLLLFNHLITMFSKLRQFFIKITCIFLHFYRSYREHQTNQSGLVEKLVSGKLGKQQFIDQEGAIVKKKDECLEKMNSILGHLRSL